MDPVNDGDEYPMGSQSRKTSPEIQIQNNVCSSYLVGGWTNPFEKDARQIGSFPQVGVKIKNIWNHHLATQLVSYLRLL